MDVFGVVIGESSRRMSVFQMLLKGLDGIELLAGVLFGAGDLGEAFHALFEALHVSEKKLVFDDGDIA